MHWNRHSCQSAKPCLQLKQGLFAVRFAIFQRQINSKGSNRCSQSLPGMRSEQYGMASVHYDLHNVCPPHHWNGCSGVCSDSRDSRNFLSHRDGGNGELAAARRSAVQSDGLVLSEVDASPPRIPSFVSGWVTGFKSEIVAWACCSVPADLRMGHWTLLSSRAGSSLLSASF
jgi:hypothetical protein